MYKLCSTERDANQQKRLEQAFLDLLLQMPYDSIRISEVCRQAGCSRKVFYRLFENKTDVLIGLIDHTLLDLENYSPDPATVREGNLHRFFSYWKSQHRLLSALSLSQGIGLLTERAIHHVMAEDSLVLKTLSSSSVI